MIKRVIILIAIIVYASNASAIVCSGATPFTDRNTPTSPEFCAASCSTGKFADTSKVCQCTFLIFFSDNLFAPVGSRFHLAGP